MDPISKRIKYTLIRCQCCRNEFNELCHCSSRKQAKTNVISASIHQHCAVVRPFRSQGVLALQMAVISLFSPLGLSRVCVVSLCCSNENISKYTEEQKSSNQPYLAFSISSSSPLSSFINLINDIIILG